MKIITDLSNLIISKDLSLNKILKKMNDGGEAVLLVTDQEKLIGVITDGDIRREMVTNGSNSNSKAFKIMNNNPVTSTDNFKKWENIFLNNDIQHLPVVNDKNKVIKIIRNVKKYKDINFNDTIALIVAGGQGTRMGEVYEKLPKCLVEINSKTILERTLEKLSKLNLKKIIISLNHEHEKVIDFIVSSRFKNQVEFFIEEKPLGTGGSLVTLSKKYSEFNFLVLNSDIIFNADFVKIKNHLLQSKSDFLICTSQYEVEIPYGVLKKQQLLEKSFEIIEKPRLRYDIISGIYFAKFNVLKNIENNKLEMDQLIAEIKILDKSISYFDIGNNWIDIGNTEQLSIAQNLPFID